MRVRRQIFPLLQQPSPYGGRSFASHAGHQEDIEGVPDFAANKLANITSLVAHLWCRKHVTSTGEVRVGRPATTEAHGRPYSGQGPPPRYTGPNWDETDTFGKAHLCCDRHLQNSSMMSMTSVGNACNLNHWMPSLRRPMSAPPRDRLLRMPGWPMSAAGPRATTINQLRLAQGPSRPTRLGTGEAWRRDSKQSHRPDATGVHAAALQKAPYPGRCNRKCQVRWICGYTDRCPARCHQRPTMSPKVCKRARSQPNAACNAVHHTLGSVP